jgi:hypothetical protein
MQTSSFSILQILIGLQDHWKFIRLINFLPQNENKQSKAKIVTGLVKISVCINHCTDGKKSFGGRRPGSPSDTCKCLQLALSPYTATAPNNTPAALHYSRFFMGFWEVWESGRSHLVWAFPSRSARFWLFPKRSPSSIYLKKKPPASRARERGLVSQLPLLWLPRTPSLLGSSPTWAGRRLRAGSTSAAPPGIVFCPG